MIVIPPNPKPDRSINWDDDVICKKFSAPLFYNDTLDYTDIIQGNIGSCWFLCTLISYLRPNMKNHEERIKDMKNSISLFRNDGVRNIYRVRIDKKNYYVDDYVMKSYHDSYKSSSMPKCIWYILLEKAMLCLMTARGNKSKVSSKGDNYYVSSIRVSSGEMNAGSLGLSYLVGGSPRHYYLHGKDKTINGKTINSLEIYRRFKRGEHVLANTHRRTYPSGVFKEKGSPCDLGAASSHCYCVIDIVYDKEKKTYLLTVCNPWHQKEISQSKGKYIYPPGIKPGDGVSIITWERFHYLFACVHLTE